MPIEELMKESESNPWTDFFSLDTNLELAKVVETSPSRTLKINSSLSVEREEQLCSVVRKQLDAFSWDYKEMKGVHPFICTCHIYIKEGCKPIRQPQRRM